MNFRRNSAGPDEPEINFIPLIDLLLVILIFLMVSTTFTRYTQLKVDLPSASNEQSPEQPDEIVVSVSADGQYRVQNNSPNSAGEPLSALALTARLKTLAVKRKAPMMVIYADAGATHQSVVGVLDAARIAGLEKVTFAAKGQSAGN